MIGKHGSGTTLSMRYRITPRQAMLQRSDLHLAKLDHTRAILQRDGAASEPPVLDVHCLGPIQHDDQPRTFCSNVVRIPATAGPGHWYDLRDIDDGARSVRRI